ncbi:host attachment protein [Schlesneria paludicola]|uniref:host attachment protein n=1 Tax=Schlesneria paludicola TaxID=360056 RepID=UPI0002DE6824|nr:host attachment protein [Schlesneria paludicola]
MITVDWVLVADRCHAKILHALPSTVSKFQTLHSLVHPEGRLTPQEMESDAPGRVQLAGNARSTVEPHEDRKQVQSKRFAHEISEILVRESQDRRFDRLFVIAPPSFLGVLRETWPRIVQDRIALELAKDLMPLAEAELTLRLSEIIASVDLEAKPHVVGAI